MKNNNLIPIIITTLIVIGSSILVVGLGGGLIVLGAYGIGWLLTRFLPFTLFEATVLSLAGMGFAAFVAARVLTTLVTLPSTLSNDDDDDDWDEEEEEADFEEDDEPAPPPPPLSHPGIPRWRQPLRTLDFSNTQPDDRCPCGSGRKYKNCHGRKSNMK